MHAKLWGSCAHGLDGLATILHCARSLENLEMDGTELEGSRLDIDKWSAFQRAFPKISIKNMQRLNCIWAPGKIILFIRVWCSLPGSPEFCLEAKWSIYLLVTTDWRMLHCPMLIHISPWNARGPELLNYWTGVTRRYEYLCAIQDWLQQLELLAVDWIMLEISEKSKNEKLHSAKAVHTEKPVLGPCTEQVTSAYLSSLGTGLQRCCGSSCLAWMK